MSPEPIIHFNELQHAGYGKDSRAVKTLSARYAVPIMRLNKRQYALKQSDYDLLLSRASGGKL